MSKTSIPTKTQLLLWTAAGGRCEYRGCNVSLIGDLVSGNEDAKFGFIAHIVADEPRGPRGDQVRSKLLAKDLKNLMLTCSVHHKLIDVDDVTNHLEPTLLEMKALHEARITFLTDVREDRASHVLTYGAPIGLNESPLAFERIKRDMLPERYPADPYGIAIEILGSGAMDSEPSYWENQLRTLRTQFARKVADRIERRELHHISIFALAPQPLLFELGRLLGDISDADVRQLHREPKGWRWANDRAPLSLTVEEPTKITGPPALVLAISATITEDRIRDALGRDITIWAIRADHPGNDIVRRPDDLTNFKRVLRVTLDRIKALHGEGGTISVFPALPVSTAVEFGRSWMPKADLPLLVYDQQGSSGFVETIRIENPPST